MAITINGKTYRNLTEQVLKNQQDIAILKINSGIDDGEGEDIIEEITQLQSDVSTLQGQTTTLNQQMARTLKTPVSTTTTTELVAIGAGNEQQSIAIGEGLTIENDTLKATSGSGGIEIVPLTTIDGYYNAFKDTNVGGVYIVNYVDEQDSVGFAEVFSLSGDLFLQGPTQIKSFQADLTLSITDSYDSETSTQSPYNILYFTQSARYSNITLYHITL